MCSTKVIHGSIWLSFHKRKDYGRILLAVTLNSKGQRVQMELQIKKNETKHPKQKHHPQLYLQIHFKSGL